MANFKFDGKKLYDSKNYLIGETDGKQCWDGARMRKGEIKDSKYIAKNGQQIAEFDGKALKNFSDKKVISTMKDIDGDINGPSGIAKAALWLLCCR